MQTKEEVRRTKLNAALVMVVVVLMTTFIVKGRLLQSGLFQFESDPLHYQINICGDVKGRNWSGTIHPRIESYEKNYDRVMVTDMIGPAHSYYIKVSNDWGNDDLTFGNFPQERLWLRKGMNVVKVFPVHNGHCSKQPYSVHRINVESPFPP